MHLVLGGPGCGKTTRLVKILEEELKSCAPTEVGFFSFTRKAAEEARDRVKAAFNYTDDDLPHFRTLHSLAFRQLGLSPDQVMSPKDYNELGGSLGLKIGAPEPELGMVTGGELGDRLVFIEQLARVKGVSVDKVAKHTNVWQALRYQAALRSFKKARVVVDFTDMIDQFLRSDAFPALKVIFIDEAQDLSAQNWLVADQLISRAERAYIGGDDDQSIFAWAGADMSRFLNLKADTQEVLPVSHRLNRDTWTMAEGIARRIRHRYPKAWKPRDEDGKITKFERVDDLDMVDGDWLVLARHGYLLDGTIQSLRRHGLPYVYKGQSSTDTPHVRAILTWETLRRGDTVSVRSAKQLLPLLRPAYQRVKFGRDVADTEQIGLARLGFDAVPPDWMEAILISDREREYYRAVRRRGESLTKEPRVKVSTIHGSKGGQASNVVLLRDMSDSCHRDYVRRPDDECRVFYVGVSRAINRLFLQHPKSSRAFHLPG